MVAASLAVALFLSSAEPPAQAIGVRALAVAYADGRRTVHALSASATASWTPLFPRIAGAETSRDGLPLFALQFEESPERDGVQITVALLYGRPHERRIPVQTVHVTATQPARADALEAFGVSPVVFSIVPLPSVELPLPSIVSASSDLEISIETVSEPAPGYRAAIVNHSSRDLTMLGFTAYRGRRPMMTGRPRGREHAPLIPAGGTWVLRFGAAATPGASGTTWQPIERLEITSLLWSDGIVEGDPAQAADERALDAGTALQLDRLLPILRAAAADPHAGAAELRRSIEALTITVAADEAASAAAAIPGPVRLPLSQVRSTMAAGMRNARSALLDDVDDASRASAAGPEYHAWLSRLVEKYAAWRGRFKA